MNRFARSLIGVVASLLAVVAVAQSTSSTSITNITCPNANIFGGGIVSKVCWNCMLPIRIAGVAGGNTRNVPLGAASATCTCPGRLFGYPTEGVTLGMWQPRHVIEIVRQPYCSPTMGKSLSKAGSATTTGLSAQLRWGGYTHNDPEDQAQYQMHYFLFPVSLILDQMEDAVCVSHGGSDMDLLYMTEIDPTWYNDALADYTTPESVLFANPVAVAACAADAVQATVYQPNPLLFWCAGSWGSLYPINGHSTSDVDPVVNTSLIATRGLAMLHRRGIAQLTMGNLAVCHAIPFPQIVRNQYKMQTMFPLPELGTNHWIGQDVFTWGEWRFKPGIGEDFVYLVYNWIDCCMNL